MPLLLLLLLEVLLPLLNLALHIRLDKRTDRIVAKIEAQEGLQLLLHTLHEFAVLGWPLAGSDLRVDELRARLRVRLAALRVDQPVAHLERADPRADALARPRARRKAVCSCCDIALCGREAAPRPWTPADRREALGVRSPIGVGGAPTMGAGCGMPGVHFSTRSAPSPAASALLDLVEHSLVLWLPRSDPTWTVCACTSPQ